ncbi:hypothetical protein NUW54_g9749 [Trametes sanguinea]|uniref:Uncharacterized protein n=1 Tax=Trametes sanguinea TaxID=158606 RepID=A0ACC1P3S0_9APHY|nr:hypothetical protein NUW54_g9749 [Trametes sanguinea]
MYASWTFRLTYERRRHLTRLIPSSATPAATLRTMSTNSPAYGGWEIFASAFGVSAVLVGVLYNAIVSQLPSRRLKGLCEALGETQSFLDCCIEEGVLQECHIQTFQRYLTMWVPLSRPMAP